MNSSTPASSDNAPVVLIVDDDANQRSLYEEELSDEGYTIVTAEDGRQALQVAQNQPPDLIVMDVNMPKMDGLDTMARFLEIDRRIPVIIHTAYASYRESFASWSADAYIVKNSFLSELKATVKRLLAARDSGA
jgi:CheY-like chemotaxis protein